MYSFIGRKKELQALEALYRKPGFQMTILYGRRRIGKSTLLQKFAEHKKVIFYTAIRSSLYRNLELLSQRVLEVLAPESLGMVFQNLEQLFSFLAQKCQKERIVFILDEFPYMAEEYPSLLSILQKAIDTEWQQGQMYLILCGSSLSFMEEKVLSEKSPLFGRRTSQLKLGPFSYLEAADFIPDCSFEEKAICYGVTGGVAKYLSLWDKDRSLDQNITDLFFQKSGYLFEEPANLLTQEFRNISSYSAIIEAVASGKTRPAEIADAAHLDSSATSHALRNLVATEIVQKNQPITDEKNRKKSATPWLTPCSSSGTGLFPRHWMPSNWAGGPLITKPLSGPSCPTIWEAFTKKCAAPIRCWPGWTASWPASLPGRENGGAPIPKRKKKRISMW